MSSIKPGSSGGNSGFLTIADERVRKAYATSGMVLSLTSATAISRLWFHLTLHSFSGASTTSACAWDSSSRMAVIRLTSTGPGMFVVHYETAVFVKDGVRSWALFASPRRKCSGSDTYRTSSGWLLAYLDGFELRFWMGTLGFFRLYVNNRKGFCFVSSDDGFLIGVLLGPYTNERQ